MYKNKTAMKGNIIIPSLLVVLCAILEPKLIIDIQQKLNIAGSNLYNYLTYLIIGLWILVLWVLLTLIPHLFSLLYNSEGKFNALLFVNGYGFLPMLIGIVISFYLIDKINVPDKFVVEFLQRNSNIQSISWINKISVSLSLPWIIYNLHKHNKIKLSKSIICVFVPFTILYLLSNLFSYLM